METFTPLDFCAIEIQSERLRLIPLSVEYASVIYSEFSDEITRYMVPATPKKIEEIEEFIRVSLDSMRQQQDIVLLILNKNTEEFIGVCGLHGNTPEPEPVLGVWVKKSAHGNHYGREAVHSLAQWARDNIRLNYMIYPCDENNIPSCKIAESLGGSIFRRGEVKSRSGRTLKEVAYKIT